MQKYISFFLTIFIIFLANVSVFAQNADFSSNLDEGCDKLQVQFFDMSTGSNLTYIWLFGDGQTSLESDPYHLYSTSGTFNVTLIVSNGISTDTTIKMGFIKIHKSPKAQFTQDNTEGCYPLTVSFLNQTIVGDTTIATIFWDFGDGQNSSDENPIHTYNTSGIFDVSLFITDNYSCNSELKIDDHINVLDNQLNASFTIDKPFGCVLPHTINFTNNTVGSGLTYLWTYGDSSSSILTSPAPFTYNNFGIDTISLIVNSSVGCTDSISQIVDINPFSSDFMIDTTGGCQPFTANFTDLSTGSTFWKWDFGNGDTSILQNPSYLFDTTGTYNITLIAGNANCTDTIIKTLNIIVYPKPEINFIALDSTACSIPFDANFSYTGSEAETWSWTFTGGVPSSSTEQNPIINYNDTLDYSVSLIVIDSNNCTSSLNKTDYIKINLPKAHYGFAIKKGCIPLSVQFLDSSVSVENISHWYWDFGDGPPILDQQNPTHTYTDTGSFSVNLIIENAKGCRDTVFLQDTVLAGDHKDVNFSPTDTSGCYKLIVPFFDLSDSVGDEWDWDFGDNGTSIEQNPTHTYADTGYFDVCLTVGFHGCYDTFCKDSLAQVFPPISRFAPSITVACDTPITVFFTDMSVLADYWEWEFDNVIDTSYIGQDPPPVTYNQQGFYTVKLLVKNSTYGCMDSSMQTISISDIHVDYNQDTTKGCMPFTCNFTDATWTNTSITKWVWMYGDGYFLDTTISTATHTYQNNGFYDVRLIITDQLGCIEWLDIDSLIEVKNLPSPGFMADTTNGCIPLTINLTDTTNNPAPIIDWFWSFGDDSVSTDANATHTYTQRGIYDVGLTVIDQNNCVGSDTIVNYITATFPFPNFTFNNIVCNNQNVTFTSTSTSTPNVTNDTLLYEWDFGDNSAISTVINPTHSYSTNSDTAVNFNVRLKITDKNGCDSTITKTITISNINAGFKPSATNKTCPPFYVIFTDTTTSYPGTVNSWLWDFGDNSQNITLKNPSHAYFDSGIFDVKLIVGNNYGCKDTLIMDSLISVDGPSGVLWYDIDTSNCTPIYIFHHSLSNATEYKIIFGDGQAQESLEDTIHQYLNPGAWIPSIYVENASCDDEIVFDTIFVDFPNVTSNFTSTKATCTSATGTATVTASSPNPPYTYLWTNNDTLITADSLMFGDYWVTVIDSIGCLGGGMVTVAQQINTYQNSFTTTNEICTGANGKATSSPSLGTPPYFYLWYNNVTTDSLTNLAKGTYYLTITDALGCLKIDSAIIGQSFDTFLSNITKKDIVCVNKSGSVTVNPDGTPPFTYSWNTGNYSSSIINLDTGKYSVTIIDALGCIISASANVEMLLNTTINASFVSDTNNVLAVIPITFTSTSVDTIPISTYTWYIENKTFTDTLGIRTYRFEESGIYNVILKIIDDYGCIDSDSITITIKDGLEVPNVFSPNGDGENDVFYIQHSGIKSYKIDIFNRWGVLLFTETAPKVYWTGKTTAGVNVPAGVYFYIIEATSVTGEIYKLKGNIDLFR